MDLGSKGLLLFLNGSMTWLRFIWEYILKVHAKGNETTLKLSILTVYKAMNSITLLFDVGYERNRQEVSILV